MCCYLQLVLAREPLLGASSASSSAKAKKRNLTDEERLALQNAGIAPTSVLVTKHLRGMNADMTLDQTRALGEAGIVNPQLMLRIARVFKVNFWHV